MSRKKTVNPSSDVFVAEEGDQRALCVLGPPLGLRHLPLLRVSTLPLFPGNAGLARGLMRMIPRPPGA